MEIIGPLLISTIAGFSTVLGGLIVFFKIKNINVDKFITFCLTFSLVIMIGISIIDLIPDSSRIILKEYGIFLGSGICLIVFIIGCLSINFINNKIHYLKNKDNSLYRLGILSMLALIFHNLPEGIATFISAYKDISLGISLGVAIMLHNIPEGICIAVPIYYATGNRKDAIKKTFMSGLAEPIGAILAFIFLSKFISDGLISIILILVAGIMITLAINELLPKILEYKQKKYVIYGSILGIITIIIQHFIL